MPGINNYQRELLSGWLDDRLTVAERAELEQLLVENPDLKEEARRLKQLRDSIEAPSISRLPENFAQRVVRAAEMRARSMGDKAPRWLRPNTVELPAKALPEPIYQKRRSNWKWAGAAIAIAAAVLVFVFAPGLMDQKSSPDNGQIGLVHPGDESKDLPREIENFDGNVLLADESLSTEDKQDQGTENPDQDSVMPGSQNNVIVKDSQTPEGQDEANKLVQGDPAVQEDPKEAELRQLQKMLNGEVDVALMMVVDVSIDPIGWESNALAKVLKDHDIPFDDNVVIEDELVGALEKCQIIGHIDEDDSSLAQEALESKAPLVSLVFVKARASRIQKAIDDINLQYKDFPDFSFGMAFDPPVMESMRRLQGIREFEITDNSARTLSLRQEDNVNGIIAQFAGAKPLQARVPVDKRRVPMGGQMMNAGKDDPVTYCLFVLRKAVAADSEKEAEPAKD